MPKKINGESNLARNEDIFVEELTEEEEYRSIVEKLKIQYRNKLKIQLDDANKQLLLEATKLLGEQFESLLTMRKALIAQFRDASKALLVYAANNGGLSLVKKLSDWSNTPKTEQRSEEGSAILAEIIQVVKEGDPQIAAQLENVKALLQDNNKQIKEVVECKKKELNLLEAKNKLRMQKVVIKMIIDFNKDLNEVNGQFNKPTSDISKKVENPFEGFNMPASRVIEDEEEEFFIHNPSDVDIN